MSEPSPLFTLVGRMKVEELARLAGTSVEGLVAAVLAATPVHAPAGAAAPIARSRAPKPIAMGEPPLAAMFGRATYRQIRDAVDRWLLARVLVDENAGNVSRTARRLRLSRRVVRERWARILAAGVWSADEAGLPLVSPAGSAPPSLTAVLEPAGSYGDVRTALDRWLIGGMLAREQGNVSRAARGLAMPRTQLRKRWARVQPG
jgi:transcriptional regulator with GAF, ATPase, and Fis domain